MTNGANILFSPALFLVCSLALVSVEAVCSRTLSGSSSCVADRRSAQELFLNSSPRPSLAAAQLLLARQGCRDSSLPLFSL